MDDSEKTTPELFTASKLASFCQVDLKTIHNWAEKGEIRHFRTPGRHLRFRRGDVLEFLRRFGYPIPEALRIGKPKVVVIDEDEEALASASRALSKRFEVKSFRDPVDALVMIGSSRPDAVVTEIALEGLDGLHLIERLRSVETTAHVRCIAYSDRADGKEKAMGAGAVAFVVKGELNELRDALERALGS